MTRLLRLMLTCYTASWLQASNHSSRCSSRLPTTAALSPRPTSFCLLSLHASTFDVVLPHLGHSSTDQGGMGISCDWLSIVVLGVRGIAGMVLYYAIPYATSKYGLVKLYRSVSALPATLFSSATSHSSAPTRASRRFSKSTVTSPVSLSQLTATLVPSRVSDTSTSAPRRRLPPLLRL
jgi:hypothetical protein